MKKFIFYPNKINFVFWLLRKTLELDFKLVVSGDIYFFQKIEFLLKKYFIILKHVFKKFNLNEDYIFLWGRKLFYDSRYGIAGLQGMLVRTSKLLKIAKIFRADTIVDIGANVGFFSILSRILYPESKIYAFEPIPRTFSCLKKNFADDLFIKFFCLALSNKKEKTKMTFDPNNSAVSSVAESGCLKVETERLDNIIKDEKIKKIDLLKIDVEGHETEVLTGAPEALKITSNLLMEVSFENKKINETFSFLMKMLCTKDYNFQLIAFRNFDDRSEGEVRVFDFLFKNIMIKENCEK